MAEWKPINNFQCPGRGCTNKEAHNWCCASDRTKVYLAQTGYIRCDKTKSLYAIADSDRYEHYNKIYNWKWNCGKHDFETYRKTDLDKFQFSISMSLQMVSSASGAQWLAALILELGKQFEEVKDLK